MAQFGEEVSNMPYADYASDAAEDMAAYDDLPFMLRRVIARFPAELECVEIVAAYRRCGSAIAILTEIRRLEQEFYHNAYADRGVLHG
ncbi:hypothetical protein [Rhizobium leguminosarum]|uniref:hypothetical protein n=1 Tax=Rhizobium leguminosarum TaxID=384 RepID=UPI00160BEDC7|nr:hypothetical protein [Rhizobium leguminosarum]MBB4342121.1 hypothetical protein [Rhizobium leguminosarum]MBB6294745.1 hypothetical protein [Rhizobium leguminosarum]